MERTRREQLHDLEERIAECRVCARLMPDLERPAAMDRGSIAPVMVIGQEPGRVEVAHKRAFAGQAGNRLDQWLIMGGANPDAPRADVYLTSVLKCVCPASALRSRMIANCSHFLEEQVLLVRPDIVVTLGRVSYEAIVPMPRADYADALCRMLRPQQPGLFPTWRDRVEMLVLPHPSGRNRWLNVEQNKQRVETALIELRRYLQ